MQLSIKALFLLSSVLVMTAPGEVLGQPAEPECNCDVVVDTQPARGPVRGIADTHAHQFSNLAFGGALFWGKPFDERGIGAALAPCDHTWDFKTVGYLDDLLPPWDPDGPPWPIPFLGWAVHDDFAVWIQSAATEEAGDHLHHWFAPETWQGSSTYHAWPRWNSTAHQQMYYRWLERAYKGGLRLMVMHTVNNAVVCRLPITRRRALDSPIVSPELPAPKWYNCDDMYAVDLQLNAVKALESFIDREEDGDLDGDGWYRIIYSPYEARQAIREGKMAVVLGIEVDALFDCYTSAQCDLQEIDSQLDDYYGKGVRHMFPLHLYNNLYGSTAIYDELWPYTSPIGTGRFLSLQDCEASKAQLSGPLVGEDASYDFDLNAEPINSGIVDLFDLVRTASFGLIDLGAPFLDVATAHCNQEGLTAEGFHLLDSLMDLKVIIDIDHLSLIALDEALGMAIDRDYPVISGHTFLFDVPLTQRGELDKRSEGHRTPKQIEIIRNLGGMIAPLNPRKAGSSTRDYVHMYRYAVDKMKKGSDDEFPGVAYASDWGAMFLQTAPRCAGDDTCCDPASAECFTPSEGFCGPFDPDSYPVPGCEGKDYPKLVYPFQAVGSGGQFWEQETGSRTFNFNEDGLAHVGLLPDFFKDLTNVGLKEEELDPLFNSAEAYIRMWEKIHGGPPEITPIIEGTLGRNGWYVSDVTVSWNIQSESTIYEKDGCDPILIETDTAGSELNCWVASDGGEAEVSVTIKRDTIPPLVDCVASPPMLWPPNHKMVPVTVDTWFSDALSGPAEMLLTTAMSSEPDTGRGQGHMTDDISGFEVGTLVTSGALRAERSGRETGREYSLGYTGYDAAGNAGICMTVVTVPKNQALVRR